MMKTLKNNLFCPILRQVGRPVNNRTQILFSPKTGCVAPGGKCNDETTYVRCLKILNVWMPVQLDFYGA